MVVRESMEKYTSYMKLIIMNEKYFLNVKGFNYNDIKGWLKKDNFLVS